MIGDTFVNKKMPSCAISHRTKTGLFTWTLMSLMYRKVVGFNRRHMYRGIKAGSFVLSLLLTLTFLRSQCDEAGGIPDDSPVYMLAVLSYVGDRRRWNCTPVRITYRISVCGLFYVPSSCCKIVFIAALLLLGGDIESNPGPIAGSGSNDSSDNENTRNEKFLDKVCAAMNDLAMKVDGLTARVGGLEQSNNANCEKIGLRLESVEKTITTRVADLELNQEALGATVKTWESKAGKLQSHCQSLEEENSILREKVNSLTEKCDYIENQSRRNNLLFSGIESCPGETWEQCEEKVREVMSEGMGIKDKVEIERAHRVGKGDGIIVQFLSYKQKANILYRASTLKNSVKFKQVFVREDFSFEVRKKRGALRETARVLRDKGQKSKLRYDKLVTSESVYTYDMERGEVKRTVRGKQRQVLEEVEMREELSDAGGAVGGRPSDDWNFDPFGFDTYTHLTPMSSRRHNPNEDISHRQGAEYENRDVTDNRYTDDNRSRDARPASGFLRPASRSPIQSRLRSANRPSVSDATQPNTTLVVQGSRKPIDMNGKQTNTLQKWVKPGPKQTNAGVDSGGNTEQNRGQGNQLTKGNTPGVERGEDRGRDGSTNTNK